MNGRRVDYDLTVRRDIRSLLADADLRAKLRQVISQIGSMAVGAGYRKALLQQNLGQAAHTDAADADKMNGYRIMKMKLIHTIHILVFSMVFEFACAGSLEKFQIFPVTFYIAIV